MDTNESDYKSCEAAESSETMSESTESISTSSTSDYLVSEDSDSTEMEPKSVESVSYESVKADFGCDETPPVTEGENQDTPAVSISDNVNVTNPIASCADRVIFNFC